MSAWFEIKKRYYYYPDILCNCTVTIEYKSDYPKLNTTSSIFTRCAICTSKFTGSTDCESHFLSGMFPKPEATSSVTLNHISASSEASKCLHNSFELDATLNLKIALYTEQNKVIKEHLF